MAQTSFALMTNLGRAKEAAALANATTIEITHIAIGDGVTVPSGGETELYNEVARKTISGHGTVVGASNVAYFDAFLAADDGPYTIREAGLIDVEGDLIAIAKYDPPISKPVPASGQTVEGTIRLEVAFSDIANITIKVDPAMMVALQRLTRLPWVPVLSMSLATPPVGPQVGDTYVVAASPTGAWSGQAGKIAEYTVAGWAIIDPPDGHGVGLPDGAAWVRVAGAYVPLADRVTRALALSADLVVKGIRNAPPGAPAEGDVWIVGTAGSDAWAGKSNQIAVLIGGAWTFLVPIVGVQANYKSSMKFAMVWWDGAAWQTLLPLNAVVTAKTINVSQAGVASPANPFGGDAFDSLKNALAWLRDWSIIGAGSVTIKFTAGVHVNDAITQVAHPNSDKIYIVGADLPGAFPVVADIAATLAASRTALRAKMGTTIVVSGSGIILGSSVTVDSLLFDHDGSGAGPVAAVTQRGGQTLMRKCVTFGCSTGDGQGAGAAASIGGSLVLQDCLSAYNNHGGRALQGGNIGWQTLTQANSIIMYSTYGLYAAGGGSISTSNGVTLRTSSTAGVYAGPGGVITIGGSSATFADNNYNTRALGGRIEVTSSAVSMAAPTGSVSHIAQVGGYINAPNVGAISSSPANNTIGNDNSYVRIT